MNRALLLVGCLLCLSLPAAAVVGPPSSGGSPAATDPTPLGNDTTPMLSVSPPAAQGYNTTEFDAGVAFSAGGDELESAFERHRHGVAIENASTETERRHAIQDALDDASARVDTLRERERTAARDYAAGEISEQTFLQRLGRVHASARTLQSSLQPLVSMSRDVGGDTYRRASTLSKAAESMTGPLRATLAEGVLSGARSERVYSAVTDDGVVLASVESVPGAATYVRETVRFDNRDGEQSTTFASASEFYGFMTERYPDATAGPPGLSIEFPGSIHRFDVRHSGGSLTAYVDGSARSIYREVHTLPVETFPSAGSTNVTENGLSVRVNQTFPTGPVKVTVRDQSGAPVDATVAIDGENVGATGFDGAHWAVAPDGEYTVSVTGDGESANVTVN